MKALFAEHIQALSTDLDELLTALGYDRFLVYSGALKHQYKDDLPYPFRVNPDFKMIVPDTTIPGCWVVWRVGKKPILLFFRPQDYWHAVPDTPSGFWVDHFDVRIVTDLVAARKHFGNVKACAFLGEIDEQIADWSLGERNPEHLIAGLNWRRSFKSPFEQACIEKANQISSGGHRFAKDAFFGGASELEISLEFQRGCQRDEYRLAYPSVVGINEHAGILHYTHRDTVRVPAADRRSLLIDAGAEYLGYASDITRTHSFNEDDFSHLLRALDTGQQQLVEGIRVGDAYTEIDARSKHLCASLLKDFGIVDTEPESTIDTGLIDYFLPHGVCHFLGLQVHDVAGNYKGPSGDILPADPAHKNLRLLRKIEVNQVFTVEPGLYFIPMLLKKLAEIDLANSVSWQAVERFLPYGGVRIEDNVVMTGKGAVNLTRKAFRNEKDNKV